MTDTALTREEVACIIERLAKAAESYAGCMDWEGGGSPMESHYEMLQEADAIVKKLREI